MNELTAILTKTTDRPTDWRFIYLFKDEIAGRFSRKTTEVSIYSVNLFIYLIYIYIFYCWFIYLFVGGWNNTASAMRYERQGFDVITVTHQPLDCSTSLPFWVSWFDSQVHVGSGFKIGQNEFMSIPNAYNTQINFIAISTGFGSTGEWTFYKLKP